MRRLWRCTTPWLGSAVVHAAALVLLAWWIVIGPAARGPLALDLGVAEEAFPPALLAADEAAAPAIELANALELETAEKLEITDPSSFLTRGVPGRGDSLEAEYSALLAGRRGPAVEFFGTVAHGQKIVFILDISGSMGDYRMASQNGNLTRFERARRELVNTVFRLYPDQEFVVLLFSDTCRPMFNLPTNRVGFYAATEAHKERIARWLETVYPAGYTDPRTSLQTALALYPDAIFLLSDGEFRVRQGRIGDQVIRLVRGLNPHGVPIHTIAYQDRTSRKTLEAIAEETGGMFRFVE